MNAAHPCVNNNKVSYLPFFYIQVGLKTFVSWNQQFGCVFHILTAKLMVIGTAFQIRKALRPSVFEN